MLLQELTEGARFITRRKLWPAVVVLGLLGLLLAPRDQHARWSVEVAPVQQP
jgi:hypothetical protein